MRISSRVVVSIVLAGGLIASLALLWLGGGKSAPEWAESRAALPVAAPLVAPAPTATTSGVPQNAQGSNPAPVPSSAVPIFSLEPQDITIGANSSNPALVPLPYYKRMRAARLMDGSLVLPARPETAIGTRWFFDLFPDAQWTGVVGRVEVLGDDRAVFYGTLEGVAGSDFIVAYEAGVMAASFTTPGLGMYQIRYGGDGLQTIIELDPAKLPTCALDADQLLASAQGHGEAELRLARQQAALLTQVAADVPASVQPAEEPEAAASAGGTTLTGATYGAFGQQGGSETGLAFTTVDILVVYTGAAQTGAGGVAGMNTLIDLCVARANASFINSRVGVRLRLVRREAVTYTEPNNISTDLDRLTYASGSAKDPTGYLDAVLTTRTSVGADLVCMITENTGSGTSGLAWLYNGSNAWGFSVVKRAGSETTFVHEIGHNFGCGHDRENSSGTPLYSYAYGNRLTPSGYAQLRTIMAYSPGQQVPYFSNPDVTYLGAATGVAIGAAGESDNAQVLENTKAGVASFQSAAGNTPPTVALTSPTDSDSLAALDSLNLAATAFDADAGAGDSVVAVRFYQLKDDDVWAFTNYSSTLLGTDTSAPYTTSVSSLKAGFITYAAVAEDSRGGIATHTVSIAVNPWYKLTRLPMPAGYTASLDLTGMNTSGQMSGSATNGSGLYQACRWDASTATLLGFLPGDTQSKAHAITDAGLVYGESISAGGSRRACRWAANGAITDLSAVISGQTATAGRGDDGAGRVLLETGSDTRYYIYETTGSTVLPLNFKGTAISSGGYVGGYDYNFSSTPNRWEAARWTSGSSAALLPPLGGYTSAWGWSVNRSGAVAGICSPTSGWSTANSRATFWTAPTRFEPSATPTDLGTLSSTASYAAALNDQGDVVGNYTDAGSVDRPFIWNSTNGIVDLNNLLAPAQQLLVQYPEAINAVGSIAAKAWDYSASAYIPVRIEPLSGLYHDYWQRKYFTAVQVEATGTAGDMDDPDGDGLPNLIERAFGMNPTTADAGTSGAASGYPAATIEPDSHKVTLQFRRLRQPTDLTYEVETSSTLSSESWSTAGAQVEQVTAVDGDWEDVTYRSAAAPAAGAPVFMRVRVTRP